MTEHEVQLDLNRIERVGIDEAILCAKKSDDQIEVILDGIHGEQRSCLLTHLEVEKHARINASYKTLIDYDPITETGFFNWTDECTVEPEVGVLTAGSSDVPVARRAIRTLQYFGVNTKPIFDVGVAGLWRLLDRIDEIRELPVVIVLAGMDAALPSVLGGLYPGLIIAVPTSVGYGVAAGGTTALNAILASCAPGIVTVNIDNGYGAACAALRMLRPTRQMRKTAPIEKQSINEPDDRNNRISEINN